MDDRAHQVSALRGVSRLVLGFEGVQDGLAGGINVDCRVRVGGRLIDGGIQLVTLELQFGGPGSERAEVIATHGLG
ncbi:MAG: hypothetical protein ACYDC4_11865 [Candidatus Dormibacteria bacterium]